MKILVLGASGFIGHNLVQTLSKDHEVTGVFHNTLPHAYGMDVNYIFKIDLTNPEDVKYVLHRANDYDVIIQAAAVTTGAKDVVERPYVHVTDNVVMNSLILRQLYESRFAGHFIFFSCTVMYQPKDIAQSEADWNPGEELYPAYFGVGNMKVYIEKQLEFYSRIGNFKCTAIRHSNVYGPHDKFDLERSHIVGATVTKVLNATDKISIWGSGRAARDLIYIDDLVDFVQKVIANQSSKYELFNCGCGNAISILDIVNGIIKSSGKTLNIEFDTSKPDIPTVVMINCDKAKELIGWEIRTSFEDGIAKTIEWVKSQ